MAEYTESTMTSSSPVLAEKTVIRSRFDGLELSAEWMVPSSAPLGVVVIIHGMCEHKERYHRFMRMLAANGYASLIHDLRGHGKSLLVKAPDGLGFLGREGNKALVEDTRLMVDTARERFPKVKVHLFGHSMGSLIVRLFLQQYDEQIDSLTVSGCVAANGAAGLGLNIANFIGKTHGSMYRSHLLVSMSTGSYNKAMRKQLKKRGQKAESDSPNIWLSANADNVKEYDKDPLCGFPFTVNGYQCLLKMMLDCYDTSLYKVKHKDLPILFLSGEDDPCAAGSEGFTGAMDFLRKLGYTHVEGHRMEGMRHEILNEKDPSEVDSRIVAHLSEA